jgi:hypothetical protein
LPGRLLVGAAVAGVAAAAVVVSAKVDGLAAESAAVVDERLVLLDGHGDGGRSGGLHG